MLPQPPNNILLRDEEQDTSALQRRILALSEQGYGLRNNNADFAKKYVAEALELAEKIGFDVGIAEATFVSGVVHCCSAEYNIGLRHLAAADELFATITFPQSAYGRCRALRWMGIAYRNIGMSVTSLEYFNQSLHFAEEYFRTTGNEAFIGYALMNMGDSYAPLGEMEKASEYRRRALEVAMRSDDNELKSQALWSVARSAEFHKEYDQAYDYYRQSYDLRAQVADYLGMGTARYGMASVLEKQGKRARAMRIYRTLWENFKSGMSGVPQTEAFIILEIGRLYIESTKPHRALPFLKRALELTQNLNIQTILGSVHELLSKYYNNAGDFEQALFHYQEFHRITSAIAQRESKQTVQYFRQAFDFERAQKEAEIYRLRNEELAAANAQNERLLLNVLPEAVAKRIKSGETTIAERFSDVTVLFADIVGFTELAAQKTPEEVVDVLNRIFSAFDIFSEQYNLEKIKTIGDSYMIVGGVPNPCDDHTESAAKMALEMQETVRLLALSMRLDLAIRIGIHSGAVVAGVIGQKKFSYDLWGDTVNIASRMESHGEAGKIHCTETVMKRLRGKFLFEERGIIDIKGKGQMKTYFLMDIVS